MDSNKRIRLWDRISELPDDILVSILSLLSLKEAGRTSVLSSRWRYLWKFFTGEMLFHYDEWEISSPQLVTHINQIMRLQRGMSIEGFTIVLSDNVSSVEDIDHWFEFVSKKRANKFELIFGHENANHLRDQIFTRIHLQPLSANWNFESLKVVGLSKVDLIGGAGANAAMNDLLSNSPNLEHLYLNYLAGLSELLVPGSCLKLRELSIERCYGLRKLEVLARNVEVFHCMGADKDIEIKGLDQLPYLKFEDRRNKWRTLSTLMDHLYRILPMGQLEKLSLDMWKLEQRRPLANRFGLLKLDKLQLTIPPYIGGDEMFSWIHLLKAAPILHTLEIKFSWRNGFIPGLTTLDTYKMKSNRSIKVVRVEPFLGLQGYDKRVVRTLIKYLKSLEKLIVVPYKETSPVWPPLPDEIMKQMKDTIAELHQNWFLPPRIELVIEESPLDS